ncbi:MAG: hypothetical protein HYX69_02920 [Planctomycetia bacterium]|nr:hypothetical protein [Planctomycetia bacterium]
MLIRSTLSLSAVALSVLGGFGTAVAAVPPGDTLFPNSTRAFVSVVNVAKLVENWEKTQLYQLFEDPVMKPFTEDLRRQLDEKWLENHEKIGLSIDDLQGIASGELSGGLVTAASGKTSVVVLVDVTGHEEKANEALKKADENLIKEGAKKTHKDLVGTRLTIYSLAAKDRTEPRQIAYFMADGVLGASDGIDALGEILARIDGKHKDTLSSSGPYQAVMNRLAAAAGTLAPDVRWYIEPLALVEFRAANDEKKLKNVKMLRNQGFGAVQAVGGYVNLSVGEYEVLHRTAVYAPKPWEKAMNMLALPNATPPAPPEWVPRDLVTYTSVNWEIKTAFEKFSTLFDELFGEGSEGVFEETIESVRDDPNGPGIDIRKDLVGHLGNRAVVVTDYKLPITTSSERFVFAAETINEPALAAAVQKSLETDPNVIKRVFGDHIIWEMKSEEDALAEVVVEHPDIVNVSTGGSGGSAALGGGDGGKESKPAGKLPGRLGEEGEAPVKLPNSAVAVAKGHLFVSSHVDFLEKILGGIAEHERLENDVDFQRVNEELKKLGATEVCVRNYTRADEQFRITYDLFKTGKLPESETVFAQIIRSTQEEQPEGTARKPKLDGSKLPDYQVARRYLGIGGTYAATEENGWLVVGFLFRKDNPPVVASQPKAE